MFMQGKERWRYEAVNPGPPPPDFEQKFIEIGRFACMEHYGAGHLKITGWLTQLGKERLIEARANHVKAKRESGKLTRRDMTKILEAAFPITDHRRVSILVARRAAQYLRIMRNGGFIVTQAPNGDWRVGTRKLSPAQLVDLAKAKGFQA